MFRFRLSVFIIALRSFVTFGTCVYTGAWRGLLWRENAVQAIALYDHGAAVAVDGPPHARALRGARRGDGGDGGGGAAGQGQGGVRRATNGLKTTRRFKTSESTRVCFQGACDSGALERGAAQRDGERRERRLRRRRVLDPPVVGVLH